MATRGAPERIHLYTYQVGFGDCFLLRFAYPGGRDRHVLIDFGTTGLPAGAGTAHLLRIARDIAARCRGRLDAVVATHRHADHINGFATAGDGKGPGDIIRALEPAVVLQPWTEQPDLAEDARAPAPSRRAMRGATAALASMNAYAGLLVDSLETLGKGLSPEARERIRFIGEANVKNLPAVRNLATMGSKRVYAWHGARSGLERLLPGVRTRVLGPPTLEQSASIARMRSRDPAEYWHLQWRRLAHDAALAPGEAGPFPDHPGTPGGRLPMSARWIARRLRDAHGEQLLQIVTALDQAMNNTSLILLFEAGNRKLLFPGDAQIENWAYALARKETAALLRDVHLYKVGHHGSLNATPRSLWQAFANKGPRRKRGRLVSVLSTMPGRHGREANGTEVPLRTLLKELALHSELHNTHDLAGGALCEELVIEVGRA